MAASVLDIKTGAPAKVRAVVGNFDDPEKRLEALKQFFPDAVPAPDNKMFGDDNFIFTLPETGKKTLYNPQGFFPDTGDWVSVGRDVVSTLSGMFGGAGALVLGQMGPQVATPEEMVTVPTAAALASEAGGQAYDRVIDAILPDPIKRGTVFEETTKAGTNIGTEILGSKIFEKTLDVIPPFLKRATQFVSGIDPKTSGEVLKQGKAIGIDIPTAGVATQSPLLLFLESRVGQMPTGAPVLIKKMEKFKDEVAEVADNVATQYGAPLKEEGQIGTVIISGAKKAAENFRNKQEELYTTAYNFVPTGSKTRLNNVIELRAELLAKLKVAPKSQLKTFKGTLDRIDAYLNDSKKQGGFDLETLRTLRTQLREDTDVLGPSLIGEVGSGDRYLKLLYSTLTKDMDDMVVAFGGEEGKKSLKKADRYTRLNMKYNVEPIINEILKKDLDNQVFNFAMQGSKVSSQRLKEVLRNLPKEGQGILKSSVLKRMGAQNPDGVDIAEEFSTRRFVTNYSRISDTAKDALFGKGESRENLEKLMYVLKNVNNTDAYRNFSKTGDMLGTLAVLGPLYGAGELALQGQVTEAAGIAATTVLGPNYLARLFTNENFINWLATSGPKMAKNPNNIKFHMGRLLAIADRDANLTEPIVEYVKILSETLGNKITEEPKTEANEDVEPPDQSSALQSIIEQTDTETRDRILQQV